MGNGTKTGQPKEAKDGSTPAAPAKPEAKDALPKRGTGSNGKVEDPAHAPAKRYDPTAKQRVPVLVRKRTLDYEAVLERLQIELREESTTHEAYQRQSERDQLRLAEVEEAQARLTLTLTLLGVVVPPNPHRRAS